MENPVYSQPIILSLNAVTLPEIKQENFTTQHVPYGASDDYLDRVNDYANNVAAHKAILLLKQNMIAGGGLMCDPKNTTLTEAIKRMNPKERSQKTLAKIARDYAKYNGFAIQVIWNLEGDKIAQIYWMDFSRVRAGAALDGKPKKYLYSRNWKRYRQAAFKPIDLPVFDPKAVKDASGKVVQPRQIYYYYEEENDVDFYPIPTYNAAFSDMEFVMGYNMYKANMMENNMFMTGIVHYNFQPSENEKKDIKEKLVKKHAGVKNAGKLMVTFSQGSTQRSVEFEPMAFTPDASLFQQWLNEATQAILTAHQLASPTLAGISGNGGLGGNASEIREAFQTYLVTYANDKQADIVDVFKELLKYVPSVTATDDLDIMTVLPPSEIPDWALDYANPKTVQKWITERLGLEFEPDDANEPNGQLPVPFEANPTNRIVPVSPVSRPEPVPINGI